MRKWASAALTVHLLLIGVSQALATGGVSGAVKDSSAVGIEGVKIYILRDDGFHLAVATTDTSGLYTAAGLPPGDYVASTRNEQGYIDELFDDMPCPGGSYYLRALSTDLLVGEVWPNMSCPLSCDPTQGTLIVVPQGGTVDGIDLELETAVLFVDDFESGDTSGWGRGFADGDRG